MQSEISEKKNQPREMKNKEEDQSNKEEDQPRMIVLRSEFNDANGRYSSMSFHFEDAYYRHLSTLIPDGIRTNVTFNDFSNINNTRYKKGC